MGVHGLWQLIEPSGKPVPLETLESKILAVDVSIWLHQAVKGFQDSRGAPVPNAHLLGIYHRVCKLLYFKVKPVFIFDGGVPELKKQTIVKRNQQKSKNISEAERIQKQLLNTLLKHSAVSKILSEKTKASLTLPLKKPSKHENMYALPPAELDSTVSSSEEDDTEDPDSSPTKHWDLHTIDMSSTHFKSLPVDVRHEILTDLKETRKQNSWGRLHLMPKKSDDFSGYQMKRLLKRQAVQSALEDAEKEMGGHSLSLAELESILKDRGVSTIGNVGKRIASDENTRYLYIKDVKQALEKAKKEQQKRDALQEENNGKDKDESEGQLKNKADQEFEDDLQKAIALSLEEEPSTSKSNENKLQSSFLENFNDADFQSDSSEEFEEVCTKKTFSSAQNYMIEYSGLTPSEIAKIMEDKSRKVVKKSRQKKRTGRKAEIKSIDISESDESDDLVEVPIKTMQKDIESRENVKSKAVIDDATVHIISDSSESNEATTKETSGDKISQNVHVSAHICESKKDNENMEKVDRITKMLTSPMKRNETGDAEEGTEKEANDVLAKEILLISKENSVGSIEALRETISTKNDVSKVENVENSIKPVTVDINLCEDDKNLDSIEIMSDSESDSSVEFLEVSESKNDKNSLEIVIDPNQSTDKEPDMFHDVLNKTFDEKIKPMEIIIDPDTKLEDDLFSDVFEDKAVTEEKSKVITKDDETLAQRVTMTEKNEMEIKSLIEVKKKETVEEKKKQNVEIQREVKEIEKMKLSVEEMQEMKNSLQRTKIDLMVERSTRERMATNITDQMYQEAQELLELFGIPYIVAPMEAEAQCAFLDAIELTDGTITDDSDIWLFGGRTVYKNFFNQSKYVMEFKAENIKHHFKLTREQMILLALLVGSDYTTGIQGIGPVTALEILAAFPPSNAKEFTLSHTELLSGLKEFQSWMNKGRTEGLGRSALKSKLKNVSITDNFPSVQVVNAYMDPTVDTSREKFSWSKPDFIALTDFARTKFGWSEKKTEEILKPVIKRLEEKRVQTTIKDYFRTTHKIVTVDAKNNLSKRVKSAIDRIGKTPEELIAEEMEALSKAQQKKGRKRNTEKSSKNSPEKKKNCSRKNDASKEVENKPKPRRIRKKASKNETKTAEGSSKRSRNKKNISEDTQIPEKNLDTPTEPSLEQEEHINEEDELKKYENIAEELKKRRQRRNELQKNAEVGTKKKQNKPHVVKKPIELNPENLQDKLENTAPPSCEIVDNLTEAIPDDLKEDEEIQLFQATTSRSLKRVEQIDREVKNELGQEAKKQRLPSFHKREVIHQKLRDKSDVLRNKLKAIEVFRKSKRGPGYVEKRKRKTNLPKEDAELSEDSSDE